MVFPVKGNSLPRATTTQRDNDFTSVEDGFSFYNTTTDRIEHTDDGGLTWLASATTEDVGSIDLQKTYDDGDGKITLSASKPIEIIGIDNSDPSGFNFNTPVVGGATVFNFNAQNDALADIAYARTAAVFVDTTTGSENGIIEFVVIEDGSFAAYLQLNGPGKRVDLLKEATVTQKITVNGSSVLTPGEYSVYTAAADSASDDVGIFSFDANTTAGVGSRTTYSSIRTIITDPTSGAEFGDMYFNAISSGAETEFMRLDSLNDQVLCSKDFNCSGDISSASLSANSLVTSNGSSTLATGDLTGDVTTSGALATTLATVNANVGTFGDATNVAQVTVNGKGLITAVTDVPISGGAVSLQSAYDGGSTIALAASTQVSITSAFANALPGLDLYAETDTGFIANFSFDGDDDLSTRQSYGGIDAVITNSTLATLSMDMSFTVRNQGASLEALLISGLFGVVGVNFTTPTTTTTTGSLVNFGGFGNAGDIRLGGDLHYEEVITSTSTIPGNFKKILCNEAILAGSLCKVSPTVDFRVEIMKAADIDSEGVVGIAANTTTAAGQVQELHSLEVFPVILNVAVVLGAHLEKSAAVNGRVVASAPTPGAFCIALEGGAIGATILAAKILNEVF